MIRKSKRAQAVIYASELGYVVGKDGEVISHMGILRKLQTKLRNGIPYYEFSIRLPGRISASVDVHQLAAYQKFGKDALKEYVVVRHLDGNSLNNSYDNLAIGSSSDNMMDRSPEDRLNHAVATAATKRVLTDSEVVDARKLRDAGASYKDLMLLYNIRSKSTMWEILNRDYVTTK